LLGAGAIVALTPRAAPAQVGEILQYLQGPSAFLLHSSSPGYLGVDLSDLDAEKAQALKLKDTRGALITLIDHDAPAAQSGLKVNDVVVALNGRPVESAERLRHMLREIPAGHKISIEIDRDGSLMTMAVQLADHHAIEHDVWNKLGNSGDIFAPAPGAMGILPGGGEGSLPSSPHVPIFGSTLKVGALVEPLTSQMADYMGVPHGLMVKQVVRKSEAAAAGLKAFDVILKLGTESIFTSSDWERALHANEGKPVQVTILRDRKQLTLILQVDSKRRSALTPEELLPGSDVQMAQLAKGLADSDTQADSGADAEVNAGSVSMKDLLHQLPLGDAAGDLEEELRNRYDSEGIDAPGKPRTPPAPTVQPLPLQAAPLPPAALAAPQQTPIQPLQMQQAPVQTLQVQQRLLTSGFDGAAQGFQQNLQTNQQQFGQMKQQMDGMKLKMEEMKAQDFKPSN
jgi:hypothetical protein